MADDAQPPKPARETRQTIVETHPIVRGVYSQVVLLSFAWHEFRALFLSEPSRIEILNKAAGGFFGIIQDTLVDALFLRLAVLSDPARSGKYENVSFDRLMEELRCELGVKGAESEADRVRQEFHAAVAGIKAHRNKRIAHADVDVVATQVVPLDRVTIDDLRKGVDLAFKTFNAMCKPLTETEYALENPIITGEASGLLWALAAAEKYHQLDRWLWTESVAGRDGAEVALQIREQFFQ
jgi:hypothetical protein